MKVGDMVRIRFKKMIGEIWEPPQFEEHWESGAIVVSYNEWEKIVTVAYKGETLLIPANDVQLVSRARTDK